VLVIAMLAALTDLWSASLLLLWVVGAFHTAVDARRRFANASTRRLWAAVAVVLPLAGPGVYLVVRPAETLAERRLRRRRLLYLELVARGAHRSFEAQPATR
jgi:Phospholipase_D-nuclease N-terminal